MRKICLIEETHRDRDQFWPRIDHARHCQSAARAKPVSELVATVSGPHPFAPVPLNSDSADRKANLCRKGAPGPLLAGPAVTDRKSEGRYGVRIPTKTLGRDLGKLLPIITSRAPAAT